MKNYFSENNTKVIGVLESKYDVDISSELTSQMDELVEYMSQLDLLNIDYKLIANNTIIKENIGYVEKKYYIRSLDNSFNLLPPEKMEYFSYFTNDSNNFFIGRKIKFNAYKYKEALLTDDIGNNRIAYNINELKTNDFIFYK